MQLELIYITCADAAEARRIVHALLSEQLIACANIIPTITSVFRWDDGIQEDTESVLLVKTQSMLFPAIEALVLAQHSYSCPAILRLPISGGHGPFLQWIEDETASS